MSSRARKKWRYRQHGINHELKRKLISTGVVDAETAINWDSPCQQKMSKVLLDFVAPYTASAGSHEEFQKVVLLGLTAWNIALLPADLRKESIGDLIVKPGGTGSDRSLAAHNLMDSTGRKASEREVLNEVMQWKKKTHTATP